MVRQVEGIFHEIVNGMRVKLVMDMIHTMEEQSEMLQNY
jgi:hypothetical protein